MNYQETLSFLFTQLPIFQRDGGSAYKANLDNSLALDKHFGSPHTKFRTIHIAGTNGKGSVSHMIASILQHAGYKTGLYTSPHLKDFRERIKINGEPISEQKVIQFVEQNSYLITQLKPSFFEITVAMAFDFFEKEHVDIAVIEVGMGGRLDSTNIITPVLSVITNIGYDHMQFLGDTLDKIAYEKAGIIKPGVPVVIGEHAHETDPVFIQIAEKKQSKLVFAQDTRKVAQWIPDDLVCEIRVEDTLFNKTSFYQLDLAGIYQKKNLLTVLAAIDILSGTLEINNESIKSGLINTIKTTGLKGRWQKLNDNPAIICDTGHNEDGIKQITEQLKTLKFNKLHFVFGMVNDKDHHKVMNLLPKDAIYYFTRASIPRALDEKILQSYAKEFQLEGEVYPDVPSAIEQAKRMAATDDLIFIGGSTFVVADIPFL